VDTHLTNAGIRFAFSPLVSFQLACRDHYRTRCDIPCNDGARADGGSRSNREARQYRRVAPNHNKIIYHYLASDHRARHYMYPIAKGTVVIHRFVRVHDALSA
jgi:hypothetical protein